MIGYKKIIEIITVSFLAFVLAACNTSTQQYDEEPDETGIKTENQMPTIMTNDSKDSEKDANMIMTIGDTNDSDEVVKDANMIMTIGNTKVDVSWEDNDSVRELRELASSGITIQMSMYGGFEQVGSIGQSLSRNDKQTTTEPGDIVLYSGNQLVVFYGSNSWSYTRLGKINLSDEELENLLGNGDVAITLSME